MFVTRLQGLYLQMNYLDLIYIIPVKNEFLFY